MPAIPVIAAVASVGLGVAGAVTLKNQQKQAQDAAEDAARRQEQAAKDALALDADRKKQKGILNQTAKVKIGVDDLGDTTAGGVTDITKGTGTERKGTSGVGGFNTSAAKIGGL